MSATEGRGAGAGAATAAAPVISLNTDTDTDTGGGEFAALPEAELLGAWDRETNFDRRDLILKALIARGLFPADYVKGWETTTGAYPSHDDPEFLQKLLSKREFAESLQRTWMPTGDPCTSGGDFEVTAVQRFAANLMSPRSPYMSALLFHGVGVGKTCAGVQIMEAWLNAYPRDRVFLVAPPTIQGGFYKTIFDMKRATLPAEEGVPNSATGCTGSSYLELTGMLLERRPDVIERRVAQAIRRRYAVFGYMAFANYIKKLIGGLPATLSEKERRIQERKLIRREFDGKLLVIDEAHNLRDVEGDLFDTEDAPGGKAAADDEASGKLLTPYLRKVLRYAEGLKLVLMTATPMYNNHREIVFMMNLIMLNEKKAIYKESMIFDETGALKPSGAAAVGYFGSRYVSYMRGENPKTFPLRLFPDAPKRSLADYPQRDPRRALVPANAGLYMEKLPIVSIPLKGECLRASVAFMDELPRGEGGVSSMQLSALVRAGNFVPPPRRSAAAAAAAADSSEEDSSSQTGGASSSETNSDTLSEVSSSETNSSNTNSSNTNSSEESTAADAAEDYRRRLMDGGLGIHFERKSVDVGEKKEIQLKLKEGASARWLGEDQIGEFSPKFESLLQTLKTCRGVGFVYTRFVESGALPLALALEANGYKPWGRRRPLLEAGPQTPGGGQCALCALREREHGAVGDHPFTQAYYGLLTGDIKLSPNNQETIRGEQVPENRDGSKMKIIIGSQIASEGVDLRYIRETHILDSWFHLNKTEQIIGRSIRFCSHSLLPVTQRNVTIYLYANKYPAPFDRIETADEYSYRVAFQKARFVGAVTRTLKVHAIDCNLNHDAIVIANQPTVDQIDSQSVVRRAVSINDMPYTAICDWLDTCDYSCKPQIRVDIATADDSTYSEFAARWRESKLRARLRALFKEQVFFDAGTLTEQFADVPASARSELFSRTVGNKLFEVEHSGLTGYILYRNGYFVFQPFAYADVHIPLSIRSAKIPVRRDMFAPASLEEPPIAAAAAVAERYAEEEGEAGVAISEAPEAEDVWEEMVAWVDKMVTTTRPVSVPANLLTYLGGFIGRDAESTKKINDILAMIQWIQYGFVVSARDKTREGAGGAGAGAGAEAASGTIFREIRPEFIRGFRYALLGYMWDNWLSLDSQKSLLVSKTDRDVMAMVGDSVYRFNDGRVLYRLYNNAKDAILYVNPDGSPANPAEIKYIEGEGGKKTDPIGALVVDTETTHDPYGFLTSKAGRVIFKTSELPKKGKVMKGKECAIVSNMPLKRELLKMMGVALKGSGLPDLELRPEVYLDERVVSGSTRACVLIELGLRFLDTMNAKGLRWFYRGVQAKKVGHTA
jgi:hypothetical protein